MEETQPGAVESIVQQGRDAFESWWNLGLMKRAVILKHAQQILLDRSEEFGRCITSEMGRPLAESMAIELEASIDLVGYYAKRAKKFLHDRNVPLHNLFFIRRRSKIHFQPLGVLGIITPWNWPLLIPLGGIVPALLSGNCVVFKPSEITPLVSQKIAELFWEAGVPKNVMQLIQGRASVGSALVQSSVEKIFFTGSTHVGQIIMEHAAPSLKKVVLEMGGHDPAIVCEDADLDVASSGILWGGFNNSGQNCNGIERVYVHETIYDDFVQILKGKMERLRIGNGSDCDIDIGPLVNKDQIGKMQKIVKKMLNQGGKCVTGGNKMDTLAGYFFEPTLIVMEDSLQSPLDEEIFGPILIATPVHDVGEAIRLANNSTFGLAASVWTCDLKKGERIAKQIQSGTVMINDAVVSFGMTEANWTGIKQSGIGWVHGEKGLDEMVNIQYINANSQYHMQQFWWFPYHKDMIRSMQAGLHFLFHRNLIKRLKAIPLVIRKFAGYLLMNRKRSDKL